MKQVFVGDFETTVFDQQEYTEVWASAIVPLFSENVVIHHSIEEAYEYIISLNQDMIIYYHNLKFDGSFWLSYLLDTLQYKQALAENEHVTFLKDREMKNKTLKYMISDMGQWYSITFKINKHIIELRDSLKLLPFSVDKIGRSFATKHKKLYIEYKGFRFAGCEISDKEKEYIKNDVFVVKEALEILYNEGHNKLTIGSCCLSEYKKIIGKDEYSCIFPDLYEIPLDENIYGSKNADEYIRKSYKGGWCYVVKEKAGKIYKNGLTADVNSLYPSVMSSESGNRYPIGKPTFWSGNRIPQVALQESSYYFIRIKTRFYLKKNHLPCIQIKNNLLYKSNEWLDRSDIYDKKTGKYCKSYIDLNGEHKEAVVILTLTMTDYELIKDHYILKDFEILDGCYFHSDIGIFDTYINKYKQIKLTSKGAVRELAKLFLNNLYGKMASNRNSSFKYVYIKDDNSLGFTEIEEYNKKAGFIPVGSAITSYARNFTIRTAQKNYYGKDKRGFIYGDTDSIHCDLNENELNGITVDDKNFCCWKLESSWDKAIFTRQKTYIEHVTKENLQPVTPYYSIRCAGMPDKCKKLFEYSLLGYDEEYMKNNLSKEWEEMSEEEKTFVTKKRELQDFTIGLIVPGKLMPKQIKGGTVLMETTYEMR